MSEAVHKDKHEYHVYCGDTKEYVKNHSEHVNEVSLESTFQFRLSVCQLVIWVEAIDYKSEEDNKWIRDHDQNYERDNVLIVSPI